MAAQHDVNALWEDMDAQDDTEPPREDVRGYGSSGRYGKSVGRYMTSVGGYKIWEVRTMWNHCRRMWEDMGAQDHMEPLWKEIEGDGRMWEDMDA